MKILIIDDMEDARETISGIIKDDLDCEIIEASEGAEGIQKIQDENPDIVITDTEMPVMDGIGVICFVKANNLGVKIILKSASRKNKVLADAEGVDFFFLGDFDSILSLIRA
jgi:two-component system, response regulator YesN